MKREPLVTIGQGSSQRTITEEQACQPVRVPWFALVCLWLGFAVAAQLWDVAARHH
jgi:hypothetical protein